MKTSSNLPHDRLINVGDFLRIVEPSREAERWHYPFFWEGHLLSAVSAPPEKPNFRAVSAGFESLGARVFKLRLSTFDITGFRTSRGGATGIQIICSGIFFAKIFESDSLTAVP